MLAQHVLKMCPCTKALNVIYHHFCEHIWLGKFAIYLIATYSQLADMFTKPLTQKLLSTFEYNSVVSN